MPRTCMWRGIACALRIGDFACHRHVTAGYIGAYGGIWQRELQVDLAELGEDTKILQGIRGGYVFGSTE